MTAILELKDVAVSYGPFVAVESVSLALGDGELLSICGRNGAGKSSLLNSIVGLEARTGEVVVEGKRLPPNNPRAAVRAGMSIVLERRGLFPDLTVEANLRVALFGRGLRTTRAVRRSGDIDRAYDFFPALAGKRKDLAGSLSGGQQQMLAIGRAVVCRPKILLLDEPSIGLAPLMIETVFQAINSMKADGLSMILVEENPQRALEVADRQIVLERGIVRLNSTSEHIRANPDEFKSAYFGHALNSGPTSALGA
jgi:branched-chain amino acid transport system ATP-binding protein